MYSWYKRDRVPAGERTCSSGHHWDGRDESYIAIPQKFRGAVESIIKSKPPPLRGPSPSLDWQLDARHEYDVEDMICVPFRMY